MRSDEAKRARRFAAALVMAAVALGAQAVPTAAKGPGTMAARGGVALDGSPYRYLAIDPRMAGAPTVIERINRKGGRIDHWWFLPGDYFVPAVAYDGSGGGLSADGSTLVLGRVKHEYPARETRLAVLDTELRLRHPYRPRRERRQRALTRIDVPGFYSFHAISPDGSMVYLTEYVAPRRSIARFELRALDLETRKLLPDPVGEAGRGPARKQGLPITRAGSRDGRWAYTLYDGNGGAPFLLALDTVMGEISRVDLPQLKEHHDLFLMKMRLTEDGGKLALNSLSHIQGQSPSPPKLLIDTRTFAIRQPGSTLSRHDVVGRSVGGRPIGLWRYGDPSWSGELLVFGCIHGDECAARGIKPLTGGRPDPSADIHLVPNLNPDGGAAGTRVNGRGVDLNRNFRSEWRSIGSRWDPEYSGPKPFSEPETRLAAGIIRRLRPEATIWFHQFWGRHPFVRAWGPSTAAGRRFARLARLPFRPMRWPAGTGPNWQNHRFRGDAAFVVELPRGRIEPRLEDRLAKAIARMGRWVRGD